MKLHLYSFLLGLLAPATFAGYQGSTTIDNYVYKYYYDEYDTVNFCSALLKCLDKKGLLAMPKSETINDELYDLVKDTTWLGADDMNAENDWDWIDGDDIVWDNWGPDDPNDMYGEDCLAIIPSENGIWYDQDCNNQFGYICQIPLDQVTAFDNSEFTFHKDVKSFTVAQDECTKMGARIVQIETGEEEAILRRKIKHCKAGGARYWIAKNKENDVCQVLGPDGLEQYQCGDATFGMICETARPHQVRVSDEHPSVLQSGDLEVDCSASGYPIPDVYWYKDDTLVSNQSFEDAKSRLLITKASLDDAGRYVCIASNEVNGNRVTAKGVSYVSVI